ncbi:MAG TPA: biotin--[acetyl-CoA-carboxylase] ligase [Methanomassiliicoccales archaeon]|jgi:BirA family biotin operon repressor/biotin-[acetyl-CoA-carboxylase] ligase|nr:biotin--[acetyl-CoA-carboxylase] ligase [Methanomassiliicoccales archaeon]HQQ25294.1 biotin--[acetyl-CoA-carboxylase] ligase [Methanomassiliicoccales archaeon]
MLIGRKVLVKGEVDSTNNIAKTLAIEGEPEGTVVTAAKQSGGKGRTGRSWESPEGGLYLSIILRPELPAQDLTLLTVLSCLPVAQAIEETCKVVPRIKWPNDVRVDGRKVAGILTEVCYRGGEPRFMVLGIGINLNTEPAALNAPEAGSLRDICGKDIDPEHFMNVLLFKLDELYDRFRKGDRDLDLYARYSESLGQDIEVRLGDQKVRGRGMHLDPDGALVFRSEDGMIYRATSVHDVVPLDRGQVRFDSK